MTRRGRSLAGVPAAIAGVALLVALTGASLDANLIVPATVRALATEAQTIVHGRVIEVRPVTRPGTRRIDSLIVFAVDDVVKGEETRTVAFRTLGGQLGRYRTFVPGSPTFEPGDEAVIFLGQGRVPYPIGLSHGVFRVRRDSRTGERRVQSPPMLRDPKGAMTIRRGDGTRAPLPLDRFLAMVRQAAQEQ